MKAISLLQPWATLVAIGAKKIETRSWDTKYRGLLAIHASKKFTDDQKSLCMKEPFFTALSQAGCRISRSVVNDKVYLELPTGSIIAICQLTDSRLITPYNVPPEPERSFGDYTPGRFSWYLTDVKRPSKPIPAKGSLGLWKWDGDIDG